jgi:hypothetical protein
MTVFEIVYPGSRIELADRDVAFALQGYLSTTESRLSEAAVSLHLFEQALGQDSGALRDEPVVDSEGEQPLPDLRQLIAEHGTDPHAFVLELERRNLDSKRRRWLAGHPPRAYTSRLKFMYARLFLFSLSDIGKLLGKIRRCEGIPTKAVTAINSFDSAFPKLKELRNSSAHVDDRIVGKARGRKIKPCAIDNSFIRVPYGAFMFVENLFGNRFSGTIHTGELVEIEVSAETLIKVQQCLQELLNSLPWTGPARHHPD